MKNIIISAILAIGTLSPITWAQSESGETSSSAQAPGIAEVAKDMKSFKGKINANAKYYAYLSSASWCPPCRAIMPDIVKEYRKMKKAGMEVILVCADRTEKDAKGYVKKYRMKFPYVLASDPEVFKLPGFRRPNGIPNVTIVDANGNVITSGHGALLLQWKDYIRK